MANITKVIFTDLFWETLSEHRKHARYVDFRRAITACILHKAADRTFSSNNDKAFIGNPVMRGLWHCKISRNPDVVMFYRLEGETMLCGMIGSHHDYGFNGKNQMAGHLLVERIAQAAHRGHQEIPGWTGIKWKKPDDLINYAELEECSDAELDRLTCEIAQETASLAKLDALHGCVDEIPEETWSKWFDDLQSAHDKISDILITRAQNLANRQKFRLIMSI